MGEANRGHAYSERIGPEGEGLTLLAYLAGRYTHSSAAQWEERIREGRVLLDAHPASPGVVLRAGQELVWHRPGWREPEAPAAFAILHRDADVLAVAKPAGLPTLPGGGYLEHTLLGRVRRVHPEAYPVHRLGRWTSGIVLFGLSAPARAVLTRAWEEGDVEKRYRALAAGRPDGPRLLVDVPIGPVPHALLGTVHAATPGGKAAHTEVRLLEQRLEAFLCDVRILTGRPHQIRIHLAAAGHPLVGDPLYPAGGVPAPSSRALPGDPGYLLHAAELALPHPRTGHPLRLTCLPPPPLRPQT